MSQNETVEELDTEVQADVATEVEDNQEEDTTSDDETLTWEELAQLRKDSESLKKANKKIAMLEKGIKKAPEQVETSLSEDALDALLDKRDFYKTNPSAKELRDEIEAMVSASKKVTREKAFAMLSWDAEIEENRKVYGKPIVNGEKVSESGFSPISIDKYDKLSASEQKAYNEKSKAKNGWVIFK